MLDSGLPAADYQVHDSVAQKGIEAAVVFAEAHWQRLSEHGLAGDRKPTAAAAAREALLRAIDPSLTRAGSAERLLLQFKAAIPVFKSLKSLDVVDENELKGSAAAKEWASFSAVIRDTEVIRDWSFLTLLREDNSIGYEHGNVLLVNRLQFVCIELARAVDPGLLATHVGLFCSSLHHIVYSLACYHARTRPFMSKRAALTRSGRRGT